MEQKNDITTKATLIGRFLKASEKKSFSTTISLMNNKLWIFDEFMMGLAEVKNLGIWLNL